MYSILMSFAAGLLFGVVVSRKPHVNPVLTDLLAFVMCALLLAVIVGAAIVITEAI